MRSECARYTYITKIDLQLNAGIPPQHTARKLSFRLSLSISFDSSSFPNISIVDYWFYGKCSMSIEMGFHQSNKQLDT